MNSSKPRESRSMGPFNSLLKINLALALAVALASCWNDGLGAETRATEPTLDTFDPQKIDAFLNAEVRQKGRVGLSVAIVQQGRAVLTKAYGKRSLEEGIDADVDTLFAIGSVTKQFTCACVLLLADDRKLAPTDKVSKYYPGLTKADKITLLDLMNHTSGYPDYYPLDFVDRRMQRAISPDELIREYAGGKLDFDPGTKWSYSNTGYILLGRIVEKVSGQSLGRFMERRIFKPLGMHHTRYEPEMEDKRLAKGYTAFATGKPEKVDPEARGWLEAAGGIYSTPSDIVKWDLGLMDGKILKPATMKLMTTPRELADGRITDYGCGLGVSVRNGRRVWAHTGAVSGFAAANSMVPSTRSAIVMMANKENGLGGLPGRLVALMLKDESAVPKVAGRGADEVARNLFEALQQGKVDRTKFSEEFNLFLTDEKLGKAATRLARYGKPLKTEVLSTNERGGLEVTRTSLQCASAKFVVLMYRRPDGIVEQCFVDEE